MSSQTMSSLDRESIQEELKKYPIYFLDKAAKDIFTKDIIQKKIEVLSSIKENDPVFFEYNPSNYNALSYFLFLDGEEFDKALELNNYVQNKWPTNIIAKTNAVYMHLERQERAKARKLLKYINTEQTSACKKEIILGKAEKALLFQKLTPKDYPIAFELYCTFLVTFFIKDKTGKLHQKEDVELHLEQHELIWLCYNVVRLYNVMLNQGNLNEFTDIFKQMFNARKLFKDIYCLCYIIIDTESESEIFLSGRAYVELGDALFKIKHEHKVHI